MYGISGGFPSPPSAMAVGGTLVAAGLSRGSQKLFFLGLLLIAFGIALLLFVDWRKRREARHAGVILQHPRWVSFAGVILQYRRWASFPGVILRKLRSAFSAGSAQ